LEPDRPVSRIVLIGFMGAGKSAVGARLAEQLGWDHADLDAWIEAAEGAPVARIFAERGEPAFRRLETRATLAVAARERVVISTGGGWVVNPEHWRLLRLGAVVVWLRVRLETALARADADGLTRPLLAGPDRLQRAREILTGRESLYAAADLTLDTDDSTPERLALSILHQVRARIVPA
jgi:shikimate kinase